MSKEFRVSRQTLSQLNDVNHYLRRSGVNPNHVVSKYDDPATRETVFVAEAPPVPGNGSPADPPTEKPPTNNEGDRPDDGYMVPPSGSEGVDAAGAT